MELKTWLTNPSGEDIRVIHDDLDFEIGGDNDSVFQVTFTEDTFTNCQYKGRIYVEGTEYGGLYRKTHSVSAQSIVYAKGFTWRGMLEKKCVQPQSGASHKVVSGDIHAITRSLVDSRFNNVIKGASSNAGVTVSDLQLDRYCTLLEALKKIYSSVNRRVDITYVQTDSGGYAEVKSVPIKDYSDEFELSKEGKLNFTCQDIRDGVNHLICLGKGEGTDRTVVHLYADASGAVSETQTLFGVDEIEEVFENSSAEEEQLKEDGIKRLKEKSNRLEFDATASEGVEEDIDIGDIVSGEDSFTKKRLTKPIARKIIRRVNGVVTIDYEVEQED